MRYRRLGDLDIAVSVVGFGTWPLGGRDYGRVDDHDSIKAIRRAVDLGVTLFDTAPIYGSGHAEEVLGQALEPVRKEVLIATKCGPIEVRPGLLRLDLSPQAIEAQCEASLRRLRTDYLDLLQVHWNDPAWPVEKTMEAMMRLVEAGKVRAVGVSNFSVEDLRKAREAAPIVSLQSRYSLIRREVEAEVLPACRAMGIGFLAYESLARGLLSGRMTARRRFDPPDIRARDPEFLGERFARRLEAVSNMAEVARRQGLTPAQAAIAWVAAQEGVTSVLVGAKNAAQVAENVAAGDMELDPGTLEALSEAVAPLVRI